MGSAKNGGSISVTIKNNAPTPRHGSNIVETDGNDANYKFSVYFANAAREKQGDVFETDLVTESLKMGLVAQSSSTISGTVDFPEIPTTSSYCNSITQVCIKVEPGEGSRYNQETYHVSCVSTIAVSCEPSTYIMINDSYIYLK